LSDFSNVKHLVTNPLIRFQNRFYVPLGTTFGLLLPTLLAWIWGDPWGGLFVAGFLRLLVEYHATFAINSFTHTFGRQPYSTASTARDGFVAALITFGEGYHNFHHRFPGDYRNGVRAYHFDPTKWWVWSLSKLRMAWNLNPAPAEAIEKAREAVQLK
jgi:stearoyl-CoA desaturase (delta-9 desaturase)